MRSKLNFIMAATGAAIVEASLTAVKTAKGYSFAVAVPYSDNGTPAVADICDSKGKIRLFTAVDDFLAEAGKLGVIDPEVNIVVSNPALFSPAPFTGDIIKRNQALLVSYDKQSDDAADVLVTKNTELGLLTAEPTTLPSYLAEKTAQRDAVVWNKAKYDAEIARITAALTPVVTAP